MKQLYDEHKNRIGLIHRVEDRNNYRNSLLFDFHKTIDPTEGSQEAEDFREVEASQEEEDTQGAEECRLEDHQEAVGDHRQCPCHRHIKENW